MEFSVIYSHANPSNALPATQQNTEVAASVCNAMRMITRKLREEGSDASD